MSILREVRYISSTEVRALGGSGDADPLRIEGYASVFNRNAVLPKFQERIKPGAFSRAIEQKQDVVCLFNHDPNVVLGRTSSGTLTLRQDAKGLWYSCELPNTQAARDIHTSIQRGDINGCSFAFNIPVGGQEWSEERGADGKYFVMRDINDVNLMDVSPVTYPCYSGTDVQARAVEAPVELRSAVDAKNKALEENLVVPPVNIEKRDAADGDEELSFQAVNDGLNKALGEKFGCQAGSNWPKWSIYETYGTEKYAIVCSYGDSPSCSIGASQYAEIEFTVTDGAVQLVGELVPVERVEEFVAVMPDERKAAMTAEIEKRNAAPVVEKRDEDDDVEDLLDDEFDLGLLGRSYDENGQHANHMNGDCPEGDCSCQNRWCPSGSSDRSAKMDAATEARAKAAETFVELRGGMTRTKRVSGRDLTAGSFAYVGDPDKTETWKFPIQDADHVRNALSRFDQGDIPEGAKAGTIAKIQAAAKKFGIDSEKKSSPFSKEERTRYADALGQLYAPVCL